MMIVTIYSLFCDDIKLLGFEKSADYNFMILTSIAMAFFFIEIILASVGTDGYFISFYFWLDLIATLSLITDIQPLWDLLIGVGVQTIEQEEQEADTGQLARGSRGARVGTRAGRIVRVIRLIRLVRIVKLYKGYENI